MKNIMLDLETMGTGPNAAIVAIGAVWFDAVEGIKDIFYSVVDLDSSVKTGGIIDASTVMWWMSQDDLARKEISNSDGVHISRALDDFYEWATHLVPDPEMGIRMWGNGAGFDNVILSSAYDRLGIRRPWNYRNDRCYRTAMEWLPIVNIPFHGIPHCALHDAMYQAECLIEAIRRRGEF